MTPEYTSIPVCYADTPVRANARLVKGVLASCARYCAALLTTLVIAHSGVTDKQKHLFSVTSDYLRTRRNTSTGG